MFVFYTKHGWVLARAKFDPSVTMKKAKNVMQRMRTFPIYLSHTYLRKIIRWRGEWWFSYPLF